MFVFAAVSTIRWENARRQIEKRSGVEKCHRVIGMGAASDTHTYTYIDTFIHTYIHTYMYAYIHECMHYI